MESEKEKKEQINSGQQQLLDPNNKYFFFLLNHRKKILVLVLLAILLVPTLSAYLNGNPIIMGGESYFNINSSQGKISEYNPLTFLLSLIPEKLVFLLPYLLAVLSVILLCNLSQKLGFSEKFSFVYFLALILSPAFFNSFITVSSYSLFLVLTAAGFLLLSSKSRISRYFSLLPLVPAALFDILSAFFLLLLLALYCWKKKTAENKVDLITITSIVALVSIVSKIILKSPIVAGPFHIQRLLPDLITDFGGWSGMGFFLLLLAAIGLIVSWKKENFYPAYLFLLIIIPIYIFNTQAVFFICLVTAFFAAIGFIKLFDERSWTLETLKKFTFGLLVLGIIFSTLTYLERVQDYGPSLAEENSLVWIKENTPNEAIILSAPENGHFIKYFAERQPLFYLGKNNYRQTVARSQQIFSALYIQDLFPLLDENNVSIIYITIGMKEQLPKEQGFLFLLKNERFKLIHSTESSEVWLFNENATEFEESE